MILNTFLYMIIYEVVQKSVVAFILNIILVIILCHLLKAFWAMLTNYFHSCLNIFNTHLTRHNFTFSDIRYGEKRSIV